MKQLLLTYLLFFVFIDQIFAQVQSPSNEEVFRLVVAQKKATDSKDALPFNIAPGRSIKTYIGHFTSKYNDECIVVCPLQQGREFVQFVLLLYKTKEGYWQNGCWYYDNVYRLKVKDFNKDAVQEIILETKINAGSREFGNYRIISLLNQAPKIWYENNTILGTDLSLIRNAAVGKEITKDLKVTFLDTENTATTNIKERVITGYFVSYSDSLGVKLDFKTSYQEFRFMGNLFIPKID